MPQAKAADAHAQGFALTEWLEGAAPGADYLASASVSYPLVGLTQLAHYVATLAKLGKTHEEMVFKGATGHSQGVASAVVLASSATTEELNANALKMVRPESRIMRPSSPLLFSPGRAKRPGQARLPARPPAPPTCVRVPVARC